MSSVSPNLYNKYTQEFSKRHIYLPFTVLMIRKAKVHQEKSNRYYNQTVNMSEEVMS